MNFLTIADVAPASLCIVAHGWIHLRRLDVSLNLLRVCEIFLIIPLSVSNLYLQLSQHRSLGSDRSKHLDVDFISVNDISTCLVQVFERFDLVLDMSMNYFWLITFSFQLDTVCNILYRPVYIFGFKLYLTVVLIVFYIWYYVQVYIQLCQLTDIVERLKNKPLNQFLTLIKNPLL